MNKVILLGIAGVLLLIVAAGLAVWYQDDSGISIPSSVEEQEAAVPTERTQIASLPPEGQAAENANKVSDADKLDGLPAFDVVRLSHEGDSVIAGRAVPQSTIYVLDNKIEIGAVIADHNGEWVFLPNKPFSPGNHELILIMRTKKGIEKESDNALLIIVPKIIDVAKGKSGEKTSSEADKVNNDAPKDNDKSATSPSVVTLNQDHNQASQNTNSNEQEDILVVKVPRTGLSASRLVQGNNEGGGIQSSSGGLSIDIVDYDINGRIIISGLCQANSKIKLYLNGEIIGLTSATAHGRWVIEPQKNLDPGLYQIKVEQLENEFVTARIEFPFSRAKPIERLSEDNIIIVQPGQNLWFIARDTLGEGVRYSVIFKANKGQIIDPDLIYPGQVLEIPSVPQDGIQ